MSLNYALLADIYPESKKTKKNKKNNALSPENPDFKLNQEIYQNPTINSKIDQLGYDPYEDSGSQTPHYVRFNQKNNPNTVIGDKDYKDFLEWKKNKYESKPANSEVPDIPPPPVKVMVEPPNKVQESYVNYGLDNSANDEFNQLLLYIFTGIFILFLYDNIYKLGKSSI